MKYVKWGIGIIVLLAAAYFYAHIAKMNLIYDKTVDNSQYATVVMYQDTVVRESFVCNEKYLDGINLKCQISGNTDGKVLVLELLDDQEKVLAESKLAAEEIRAGKFNKFLFTRVTDTLGHKFHIRMTVENENLDQDGVFLVYYQAETMEDTCFYIDEEETEGTLIAKTITNRFDLETFVIFILIVLFIVAFMKVLYKLFK